MSVPAQKAIRWLLTVQDVRLKLYVALHHLDVRPPDWLKQFAERGPIPAITTRTLMTVTRAREYEAFLTRLDCRAYEVYGRVAGRMFASELGVLRRELESSRSPGSLEKLKPSEILARMNVWTNRLLKRWRRAQRRCRKFT